MNAHPSVPWACTSFGACAYGIATSIVIHSIPFLQFTALIISILAGAKAIIASRKK